MKKQILSKIMIAFMVANFSLGGVSTFASTSEDTASSTSKVEVQDDNTYDSEVSSYGNLSDSYKIVYTLKVGQSMKITNKSSKFITLLNNKINERDSNIDSVQYTSDEKYDYCKYEQKNATVSVNDGCYTIVTNNGTKDITYGVEKADADSIKIENSASPAYEKYTLKAGQKYEITNNSTTSGEEFQFTSDKNTGTFDRVTLDSENKVINAELAENCTYLNIYMNNKARLLPKKDITIGIPYTHKKYISIKTTNEGVLTAYKLKSGQTYSLTNDGEFIPLIKCVTDDITAVSSSKTIELKNKKGLDVYNTVKSVSIKNNESKDVTIWLPSVLDNAVSIESTSGTVADKKTSAGGSDSGSVVSGDNKVSSGNDNISDNKDKEDTKVKDSTEDKDNTGTFDASNLFIFSSLLAVSSLGLSLLKKQRINK